MSQRCQNCPLIRTVSAWWVACLCACALPTSHQAHMHVIAYFYISCFFTISLMLLQCACTRFCCLYALIICFMRIFRTRISCTMKAYTSCPFDVRPCVMSIEAADRKKNVRIQDPIYGSWIWSKTIIYNFAAEDERTANLSVILEPPTLVLLVPCSKL